MQFRHTASPRCSFDPVARHFPDFNAQAIFEDEYSVSLSSLSSVFRTRLRKSITRFAIFFVYFVVLESERKLHVPYVARIFNGRRLPEMN